MKNVNLQKYRKFAPLILRISLGTFFLLFGVDKLTNPNRWMVWVPSWIWRAVNTDIFLLSQGIFEALIGGFLITGLFTRTVATIASILIFLIIVSIGFNEIAIRDIGLLGACIALILLGSGELGVDHYLRK